MQGNHLLLMALAIMPAVRAESEGDRSLFYARQASAMLGPTLWKRVIIIQNSAGDSRYPRSLGAVVFEMGGILWFYTSTEGTQSLSVMGDHAKEDELNLGPLLSLIDSGFSRWEPDSASTGFDEKGPIPPNACFIQSISLLRHRLAAGMGAEHAKLLSYYVAFPTGVKGHTVLYLETSEGPTIIDPLMQRRPIRVQRAYPLDAKSVACCVRRDISNARWVTIGPNDFAAEPADGAYFANNCNGEPHCLSMSPRREAPR